MVSGRSYSTTRSSRRSTFASSRSTATDSQPGLTAIDSAGVPAATWWAGTSRWAMDFAPRTLFVGQAHVVLDHRVVVVDVGLIEDVVVVAVDVGVVGDRDPVPDGEFPAVVEVDVVVDDDVVADADVVAVGERDALEEATVLPTRVEEVLCEHSSKAQCELDVVGHRRGVELPPEPLEVLRALEALGEGLDLGVVLALQGRVAGIVSLQADPLGGRDVGAGLPALVCLAVAEEVDEHVLDDVTGVLLGSQAFVDLRQEIGKAGLRRPRERDVPLGHATAVGSPRQKGFPLGRAGTRPRGARR